jgi:hypothetical protein
LIVGSDTVILLFDLFKFEMPQKVATIITDANPDSMVRSPAAR